MTRTLLLLAVLLAAAAPWIFRCRHRETLREVVDGRLRLRCRRCLRTTPALAGDEDLAGRRSRFLRARAQAIDDARACPAAVLAMRRQAVEAREKKAKTRRQRRHSPHDAAHDARARGGTR